MAFFHMSKNAQAKASYINAASELKRRKFLMWVGASIAAAALPSCKKNRHVPVQAADQELILPGTPQLIALNSRFVAMGDSITVFYSVAGIASSFNSTAYVPYANLLSGNKLYMPFGGDQGIPGNTTTQMLARIGNALALKPKLMFLLGGTNDLQAGVSADIIISNLKTMIDSCKSIGCKVLAITILPRFAMKKLSAADEASRIAVNAWLKGQESDNVTVADAEAVMDNEIYYTDGLHPNSRGALRLGSFVATKLNNMLSPGNMASVISGAQLYTTNPALAGSNGTKAGATGAVADSFHLGAANAGGATVSARKEIGPSGLNQQVIMLSGSYTGSSKYIELYQDHTASAPAIGDILEGFADIEIVSQITNLSGLYFQIQIYTAGYASTLANVYGIVPVKNETDTLELPAGRYTLRTPQVLVSGGTPVITANVVNILLKDSSGPSPVSGEIRINRITIRKIPSEA